MFGAALENGTVLLGKYRVERELGRGGMGVVIAARHINLGELFAIKLLHLDAAGNPTATSRFIGEARAAARLRSEHTARVFDADCLDDGTPYFVMEHLTGDTLSQVLERRGPLPLAQAVELVLHACDALAEAHALGIVHRDIKLSNLFLTHRHGGQPCLKVIDFGISKQSGSVQQLTTPGAILGSPLSMAPEQIRDPQAVDGRTDIWSLGVVLYQLTTGEVPFRGETFPQLLASVLGDTPAPPSRLRPGLPAAFDEVVARCLRKRKEERYARVEELAEALRALLAPLARSAAAVARPDVAGPRVFISCRCDDPDDLEIATGFYEALSAAGVRAFLAPRSVAQRERWISDASEALQSCDAFLLLLSPRAAVSEMVAAELDTALELAASNAGRPHVMPVRLGFSERGNEPNPLEDRLSEFENASWRGPLETAGIIRNLLPRIGREPSLMASAVDATSVPDPKPVPLAISAKTHLELPGGTVSRRSEFYVVPVGIEKACQREIAAPGALLRIRGPRQTGKSSLMTTITDNARSWARTVSISLHLAEKSIFAEADRLLRWLCTAVTRRLKFPEHFLRGMSGAKDDCTAYFEEHLLVEQEPLVLTIDHLDRVFESPGTAEEFLTLLRAWHEMGKCQPPWDALRLVLAYSTEGYLPLHTNHSPFNVGYSVDLGEWDAEIVADLAQRHGLSWRMAEVERLMSLIGGHPHLVRQTLYHVARGTTLDAVLATAATDEGLFADHLRHLLWHVQCRPVLCKAVVQVMETSEAVRVDTEVGFKLVSLGLVEQQGNDVRAARELYRRYFAGRLLSV